MGNTQWAFAFSGSNAFGTDNGGAVPEPTLDRLRPINTVALWASKSSSLNKNAHIGIKYEGVSSLPLRSAELEGAALFQMTRKSGSASASPGVGVPVALLASSLDIHSLYIRIGGPGLAEGAIGVVREARKPRNTAWQTILKFPRARYILFTLGK